MKYLFILAFKNIIRAKTRTILTFLMLSFGIAIYIFTYGMFEGFDKASFKNMIDFEVGHIKIRSSQFDEERPYEKENVIMGYKQIETELQKFKFIKGYTKRLLFLTNIDNGVDSAPAITIGIDSEKDKTVFSIGKYIVKGKLEKGGALIGKSLANDMQLEIGSVIYITFRNASGMYTSLELIVTGMLNTADPKVNNSTAFINLDEAQESLFAGVEENKISNLETGITEITIKTDNFKKVTEYKTSIQSKVKGFRIESWKEISSPFAAMIATKKKGTGFFLIFIIIIALVGIINTILMSVYEKKQEIGTLMALGMEHREVRNIFLFEGLIIGICGSVLGVILGTVINLYFVSVGIDYSAFMGEDTMGLNVMGVVKSSWEISSYIKTVLITIIASVFSSYYPAKKIMKMQPMECLRTVQ